MNKYLLLITTLSLCTIAAHGMKKPAAWKVFNFKGRTPEQKSKDKAQFQANKKSEALYQAKRKAKVQLQQELEHNNKKAKTETNSDERHVHFSQTNDLYSYNNTNAIFDSNINTEDVENNAVNNSLDFLEKPQEAVYHYNSDESCNDEYVFRTQDGKPLTQTLANEKTYANKEAFFKQGNNYFKELDTLELYHIKD